MPSGVCLPLAWHPPLQIFLPGYQALTGLLIYPRASLLLNDKYWPLRMAPPSPTLSRGWIGKKSKFPFCFIQCESCLPSRPARLAVGSPLRSLLPGQGLPWPRSSLPSILLESGLQAEGGVHNRPPWVPGGNPSFVRLMLRA